MDEEIKKYCNLLMFDTIDTLSEHSNREHNEYNDRLTISSFNYSPTTYHEYEDHKGFQIIPVPKNCTDFQKKPDSTSLAITSLSEVALVPTASKTDIESSDNIGRRTKKFRTTPRE